MRIQAVVLVIALGSVLSQEFTSDIIKDLAHKLSVSSPQYNRETFNRLSKDASSTGGFYSADGTRSDLQEIKNREIKIWIFSLKPFHEIGVLNWGSKLESLTAQTQLSMQGDTLSFSGVTGTLGERVGDKVRIRVATGNSSTKLHTQYTTVSYEHCEWFLFIKNCSTRHRQEPRGYTFDET